MKNKYIQNWRSMKQRCSNPNHPSYHNYGGRGITICERWLDPEVGLANYQSDIQAQLKEQSLALEDWALGSHTLDRKDNDGDYRPSNVRFATTSQQNRNTRTSIGYQKEQARLAAQPKDFWDSLLRYV